MSQDMAAMMKQQMQQSITAACNSKNYMACTGVSVKKCLSAATKTMSTCDHLFPKGDAVMGDESAFNAHGACMESHFPKNMGISANKLDTCDPMANAVANAPPEQLLAMISEGFKQHTQSIGTDRVTLPLYKNATIMSHMRAGDMSRMYDDVENLSALKMESPDKISKIASYYRSKLKGFREYKIQGGIIFMKNGPKDFDLMRDMKKYVSTPHVEIMPIQDFDNASQGAKSAIQISYKE